MRTLYSTSFDLLNQKGEGVKKMRKGKFLASVMVSTFALAIGAAAYAQPITLLTDRITKLKFTNYEKPFDNDGDTFLSVGDKIEGILKVTSISDIPEGIVADPLVGKELTGHFKFTIIGTAGGPLPIAPFPGAAGHLDFGLAAGDFIKLYADSTPNWNPDDTDGLAIARATDSDTGLPWIEILPGTFYEGINDTTIAPVAFSLNQNWADLTTNNTGYSITPLLYPEAIPAGPVHTFLGAVHPGGHLADIFFTSHLTTNLPIPPGVPGWLYRSEDPVYVRANVIPEPSTFILLGAGLLGVGVAARRKMKHS